jgi:predicted ATPase/DNA-binding SARP family transcriptional activator
MEFRILGPLEVISEERVAVLEARKLRALLAILLLHANEPVSSARLIEDLWEGRPPPTAAQNLRTYIHQLRKAIAKDLIVRAPSGYELRVEPSAIDAHRFEDLVVDARGEPPAVAAQTLRAALALWRGSPLVEFAFEAWAQGEIARLEELRIEALEERIDADLALGRAGEVVTELDRLVSRHPLRERLRGQLMLALYRAGRQADALAAFRDARRALVDELGLEPGPALRDLERAILEQSPRLDLADAGGWRTTRLQRRRTTFIGRTRELREVRRLLEDDDLRLVTITGTSGAGKTRLAVEATAGRADVTIVELAPVSDPNLVAGALADWLDVRDSPGRTRAEALFDHLRHRRLLLVLDNFEQVLEAAPLLEALLAEASGLRLLVTSRAPLALPDEHVYSVPPLRRTEAIKLYCERAREAHPGFQLTKANAAAVAVLCERLDGLPLALELAAARSSVLSPRALLDRMGRRFDLLKPLRAAIEWSYDLLSPDVQELFATLGVFVGGFTVEHAEACHVDLRVDVVEGLQSLLRNNLLTAEGAVAGEPRLGMLETIREYALEQLAACADVDAARRRHALHFAAIAEAAEEGLLGPDQLEWLERLDADRDNIRAALTWAVESHEAEIGLRIAASLWRYWNMRNHEREARERLEELLALGSATRGTRAKAQTSVASMAQWQGDHETIRRMCEASVPVHRELGKLRWLTLSLGLLATSAVGTGDLDEARAITEHELELAREAGDRMSESYALAHLSVTLAAAGRLEEGERALDEAVRLARILGNLRSVASFGMTLAGFALVRGDHARARDLFEESLATHRRLSDGWGIPMSLLGLTYLALEGAEYARARTLLGESLGLDRENGDQPGLANDLEMAARLAATRGCYGRAVEIYASSAVLRAVAGRQMHLAWWQFWWPDPAPEIAELRAELGEEEFGQAWARGREMSVQEAIDSALEETLPLLS